MEYMKQKYIPIRGQKFDIGRTINPMKCQDCKECNFATCSNYAMQMRNDKYSVSEFMDFYSEYIKDNGITDELVGEFISQVLPSFPKGLYWQSAKTISLSNNKHVSKVEFCKPGKHDIFHVLGTIRFKDGFVEDIDLTQTNEKFLNRIAPLFVELYQISQSR